jgi:hypothetical protein
VSIAHRSAGEAVEAIVQSRASNQMSVFSQSVRGLVRLILVADAPRHAAGTGAHGRAIQLLKQNLSPVQLEQYKRSGHFDVIGGDTGRRYRIRRGYQMNVELLDKNGRRVCCMCFMPAGPLAAADIMLAQKIALELFEVEALNVANKAPR